MIAPTATVLDIVAAHRACEAVFRSTGERIGVCILCEHLFETVEEVASRLGLDLPMLLAELQAAARQDPADPSS